MKECVLRGSTGDIGYCGAENKNSNNKKWENKTLLPDTSHVVSQYRKIRTSEL